MAQPYDSKQGAAVLIDPLTAPEPSAETGPGAHFTSTFAPASEINGSSPSPSASKNPYRTSMTKTPPSTKRSSGDKFPNRASSANSSPRERFPDYRAEAFADYQTPSSRRRAGSHGQTPPSYQEATSSSGTANRPRRGSSLKERYPGDKSHQPLDIIRRDSKKAYRSPHLHKRSIPGADSIDRLDPAVGGIAYHHEGPYDAALLSRNRNPKTAPLGALEASNEEALKATPKENIRDAVERHKPLDGVAAVPPGEPDRFGRVYRYKEGTDLLREGGAESGDAGYKRWPEREYDPEDLKGHSEPSFSLDRALRAHQIDENNPNGIELTDRAGIDAAYHRAERNGTLDTRDPVDIAGGEGRYADMEIATSNDADVGTRPRRSGSESGGLRAGLKKRIGSLRRKNAPEE